MISKPALFIVESLDRKNCDENKREEGWILSDLFSRMVVDCKYVYIRTIQELENIVCEFKESKFRYLHLSMHGSSESVSLTYDKDIPFEEFYHVFGTSVKNRRIFLSSCDAVNANLARLFIRDGGAYSLVGPQQEVSFFTALSFWVPFYAKVFADLPSAVKMRPLQNALFPLAHYLGVEMAYFSRWKNAEGFLKVDYQTAARKNSRR